MNYYNRHVLKNLKFTNPFQKIEIAANNKTILVKNKIHGSLINNLLANLHILIFLSCKEHVPKNCETFLCGINLYYLNFAR